jgi:hypothetical protein
MPRTIKTAAIQMDANPASTAERIARADRLVRQAAAAGAQLLVLPELFHLGYSYDEGNFARAETLRGPTATWMRDLAAGLNIHLAGSVLLRDGGEIYNSLLLFAPSGQMWRYDKNYPWGWERGYFRGRRNITVAATALGRIGMLVCWDVAHRNLWRAYAGNVDLMIISSCPPDVGNPTYRFPSGATLTMDDLGPLMASMKDSARQLFGSMVNQQTAWLGVPAVATVGTGQISTAIPRGKTLWRTMIPVAPGLARYLPEADQLQMSCGLVPGCKVIDASGNVIAELPQEAGESWTSGEVTLADRPPQPRGAQPASTVPPLSYALSDMFLPALMRKVYNQGRGVASQPGRNLLLLAGLAALLLIWWRKKG